MKTKETPIREVEPFLKPIGWMYDIFTYVNAWFLW